MANKIVLFGMLISLIIVGVTTAKAQSIYGKSSIYTRSSDLNVYQKTEKCHISYTTDKYDRFFQEAVFLYYPKGHKYDWCLEKSKCTVESGLDPNAESGAGAKGNCQIMDATWKQLDKGHGRSPFSARWNIMYSSIYMSSMFHFWITERPWPCRVDLALASYNAGAGSILKTQKYSGGLLCWEEMKEFHVERVKDKETYNYVNRIRNLLSRLR